MIQIKSNLVNVGQPTILLLQLQCIIKVQFHFRIKLLILLGKSMSHKSPFTLFYNEMIKNQQIQKTPPHLQDQRGTIKHMNKYQTHMSDQRASKAPRRETKLKIFGFSDKRRSKDDKFKNIIPLSIQTRKNAQRSQEEFNLLQSKTFEKKYCQKSQDVNNPSKVQNKSQSFNQLHKLLGLSEQPNQPKQSEDKNKQQVEIKLSTEHYKQQMDVKLSTLQNKQPSVVSKPRDSCLGYISIESMLSPSPQNKHLNQKHSQIKDEDSKHSIVLEKTYSRFLPSQLNRKETTPFQSQQHSRIDDLIAEFTPQTKKSISKILPEYEEVGDKNQRINVIDLSKISKKSSIYESPIISQKLIFDSNQILKVKSCERQILSKNKIQRFERQTQQNQKKIIKPDIHTKPFLTLSKKSHKKNETNLGEYLHNYGSYERQVQNLIDRFQKIKILKEKEVQIKQQINKLTQKHNKLSNDNMKNYYFPQNQSIQERSHQNINLYYTKYPNRSYQQSHASKPKKHQSYDSNLVTESPHHSGTQIQRELKRNVASMQKIIKKFKKISKNLEVRSSETSSIVKTENKLQQTNRRSLLQQHINKSNTGQSHFLKSNMIHSNIRHPRLQPTSNDLFQSQYLLNSREMTQQYTQADKKENTLQQVYSTNIADKRTSRTQKKYPVSHKKERQSNDQNCKHSHKQLLKQLKRLNEKILYLEQKKQKKLSHIKSDSTLNQMRRRFVEKNQKTDENQKQNQSDVQPSVNVSIPAQIDQQSYCYQNQTSKNQTKQKITKPKKKQQSTVEAVESIQRLKSNLNFPIFYSFPSSKDSLAQLVEIGSYMFQILYKFVSGRKSKRNQSVNNIDSELKVKKYMNFIHYFAPNELNYHLIYYFKGNIYFGQWHVDQIEGYGYKHGQGYYYHPHKYVYQGRFILDKKEGYGYAKYTNGQVYEGQWRKNKKQGKGILINCLGDSYKGTFKGGKKHGKGKEYLSNGDYYKGEFKQGKIEGQGKYVWSDGSIYKGQFKDGKLNGNGIWKSKQNDFYQGKFQDNKKQGQGIYKWNNGIMYAGYFMQDKHKKIKGQFKKTSNQKQVKRSLDLKRLKNKQKYTRK